MKNGLEGKEIHRIYEYNRTFFRGINKLGTMLRKTVDSDAAT